MLNNNVKEKRQSFGMSISELARRTNVSRNTIWNIENHRHEPSGYLVLKIPEVLLCEPKDIFFANDVKNSKHEKKLSEKL